MSTIFSRILISLESRFTTRLVNQLSVCQAMEDAEKKAFMAGYQKAYWDGIRDFIDLDPRIKPAGVGSRKKKQAEDLRHMGATN